MAESDSLSRQPAPVAACDPTAIRLNIAGFALRDQGRWDELRDLFHPDARIAVSWYVGSIAGFIERSAHAAAASSSPAIKHLIGASRVTVANSRAIADTDVTLTIRAQLGPIEVDLTSYLRFFDRFERREDRVWRVVSRTGVYEKDRIDPVSPSPLYPLYFRLARFHRFPRCCRHLAGSLARNGQALTHVIEAGTKEETDLRRDAEFWLEAQAHSA